MSGYEATIPKAVPDHNGAPVTVGDLVVLPMGNRITVTEIVFRPSARGGFVLGYVDQWGNRRTYHPCHVVKVAS